MIRMVRNLTILLILEVVEIFDWLGDIVSGLGDAIGNAFGSISDKLIDGILNRIIQWIFTVIYDGIAEFFTMISGLGVEIFTLDWVNAVVKLKCEYFVDTPYNNKCYAYIPTENEKRLIISLMEEFCQKEENMSIRKFIELSDQEIELTM